MTTIITRLFANEEKAAAAAKDLKAKGFDKSDVDVISSGDGALAAILGAGVYKAAAETYAKHVKAGKALTVVRAPYGNALRAQRILDEHDPIAADVRHTEVYLESKSKPSCASKNRYLPILLNSDVLVLSDGIFPRAVLKNFMFSSIFGLPMLSGKAEKRGPLWSGSPTPFSSMLGLPLLTKGRGPRASLSKGTISGSLGVPTLTNDRSARH